MYSPLRRQKIEKNVAGEVERATSTGLGNVKNKRRVRLFAAAMGAFSCALRCTHVLSQSRLQRLLSASRTLPPTGHSCAGRSTLQQAPGSSADAGAPY